MSKYQFDQILDQLKKLLSESEYNLEQLVDSVNAPADRTTKVIRWLMDNGKIISIDKGLLSWK